MSFPSFTDFFRDVWGFDPFPWQARLADRVLTSGWPEVLDVPTGAGKTATLDIALYHLAHDGGVRAPRRIILVVDRRVIVDQVGVRARQLRRAVEKADSEALSAIRDALTNVVGQGGGGYRTGSLLETTVLRGASLRDDAWALHPHVPVLAASTVDQVGSRFLFRGYGVSDGMKPVHAGLMGCDTLLLLDEVHLARPFADVLDQIARLRGPEGRVPRRFRVVQLSATPGAAESDRFGLEPEDLANQTLSRRMSAAKPASLDTVKTSARGPEDEKRAAVAKRAAEHARAMIDEGKRAVAVVVNRVDTARRVWGILRAAESFDSVLITGRMRPLDQQEVLASIEARVLAGREDDEAATPIVVVATQCIEAGADFDFDGLVTECASLDALRQRFGRLDRRGDRSARAVIVARSDQLKGNADPIYGDALAGTWSWLETLATQSALDLGISALQPHLDALGAGVDDLRAPSRDAPVVLPAYMDQWAQTNPRPHADPDVSLFLHGIPEDARSALPDVQVVWRADITEADLEAAATEAEEGTRQDTQTRLMDQLAMAPPGALEALSLPVWHFQAWASLGPPADADDDISDLEGMREPQDHRRPRRSRLALIWAGRRESRVVDAWDVPPGSLVVVPAERGGLGAHRSFDPHDSEAAPAPVRDLGDAVQLLQRGRPLLRLDPRMVGPMFGVDLHPLLPVASDEEVDVDQCLRLCLDAILSLEFDEEPAWSRANRSALGTKARFVRVEGPNRAPRWAALGRPLTPSGLRALLGAAGDELAPADATTEGDDGSFIGAQSTLAAHLLGVGQVAESFALASRLPDDLVAALRWAGLIHDVGKVDRRFQLWLYGGDEVDASVGDVLAKSALPRQDAAARRRARERAGYRSGQRHELVSLDMAERSLDLRQQAEAAGADWDLVLHLVASHHGWCRPLGPAAAIPEDEAEEVRFTVGEVELAGTTAHGRARMSSGVVDRFWRLVRRYGWHELAYLEAVLRLADHRRSSVEQQAGGGR